MDLQFGILDLRFKNLNKSKIHEYTSRKPI